MTSVVSLFSHVLKFISRAIYTLCNFLKIRFISLIHVIILLSSTWVYASVNIIYFHLLSLRSLFYPQSLAKHICYLWNYRIASIGKSYCFTTLNQDPPIFLFTLDGFIIFRINFLNSFSLSWCIILFRIPYTYAMFSL